MNIFCRADGTIFHIDTENIYQGSVGVNKIRFIGQFPSSAQVTMRCALPDGMWTNPILLTHIPNVAEVEAPNGGKYSVWEGTLNYAITEHYGQVSMQFDVYSAGMGNERLCTATATINIIKGVPIVPTEFDATDDAQELLNQILNVVSSVEQAFNNVNTELYGEGGTYNEVKGGLKKDVKNNASAVQWLYSNAGTSISFSVDESDYILKLALKNADGVGLGEEQKIYLPIESVVVDGRYDSDNKNIVLTLKNGNEITISVAGLISGLVSQKDFDEFKNTKGQPNGLASLNEEGIIPGEQLPPLDYLPLTGGTVDGGIGAVRFIAGTGEDEVIYGDGLIEYGGHPFFFPEEAGTLARLEDITALESQVKVFNLLLGQLGYVYTADDTATWNERITADGENILNGSDAVLKKVVGSTVACKNLLPYPYDDTPKTQNGITFTDNGITFTDNGDGTITANGTAAADADAEFMLRNSKLKLDVEKLTMSGVPTGASSETFYLYNIFTGAIITDKNSYPYNEDRQKFKIVIKSGVTVNNIVFKPMLNEGDTALPYQPYFAGLKSASFGGIESTGKNLIDETKPFKQDTRFWNYIGGVWQGNNPYYQGLQFEISVVKNQSYTVSFEQLSDNTTNNRLLFSQSENYDHSFKNYTVQSGKNGITFSTDYTGKVYLSFVGFKNGENFYFKNLQVEHGDTATEYEPYRSEIFSFPKTETPLGTTIDFENKKIIKEYAYLEQSAPFTEEQLTSYTDYIISQDGKSIMYKLSAPIETDFTKEQLNSGNEYAAYKGGMERVLGNDGAEYGANNTLTVNYIYVKEANNE